MTRKALMLDDPLGKHLIIWRDRNIATICILTNAVQQCQEKSTHLAISSLLPPIYDLI